MRICHNITLIICGKTIPVCIRIEIHFIAYYNCHTQALSRHSDIVAIDKMVYFYRWLFTDPIKPHKTNTDPMGPLGYINRVACSPKLFHLTPALLVVWSGLLWPFVWPTVHTTWLPESTGIVNPPTFSLHPPHPPLICSIHDISGCLEYLSKSACPSSNYIKVSVIIAISLLYFCYKSYVATIKHKESIILFIFQICISQNPGMCKLRRFSKIRSHII